MRAKVLATISACLLGAMVGVGMAAVGLKAVLIGYVAASVCICLPFIYAITAPDWRKSRAGRALMMLLSSLAALLSLLLASGILQPWPDIREILRYVVYSYVLVAGVRLAVLFFQLRFGADWAKNRGEK